MVSSIGFTALVGFLVIQRLFELRLSKRNEAKILSQGGKEYDSGHYPAMVLLHTTWFLAMIAEVWVLQPAFSWGMFVFALMVTLIGQSFRYAAIKDLGWRWSTRIMILPEAPLISSGIYKYIRHPNYVGVILEIAAVPLLHSAWRTSLLFSIANGMLLWVRIKAEEKALEEFNQYSQHLGDRPRFIANINNLSRKNRITKF